MYAYLKGEITYRSPSFIALEVGGVGYHLNIPVSTFSALDGKDKATIYTHFHVREDAQILYGFATQAERNIFVQLISVSGVGPNTAQIILSSMSVDEIRQAILSEQAFVLQRVKGIGVKSAKQIILDLKDKIAREGVDAPVLLPGATGQSHQNQVREEAIGALVNLGFGRIMVQKAVNAILKETPNPGKVEDLIKSALKNLSGN